MPYKLKISFITFIITFATLLPISSFIAINNFKPTTKEETKETQFDFVIPKSQNLTMLITSSDNDLEPANIFVILKISAHDNTIAITHIPKEIKTIAAMRLGNLQQLSRLGRTKYVKEAIENLTSIEINKTIELTKYAIEDLIDNLGGLKIPCHETKEDSPTQILDEPHYKTLNGKQFFKKFKENPTQALAQLSLTISSEKNLNHLFKEVNKLCKTDISKYDFEIRKKGFEKMIKSEETKLKTIELKFEDFNDRQKPTKESKDKIKNAFLNEEAQN